MDSADSLAIKSLRPLGSQKPIEKKEEKPKKEKSVAEFNAESDAVVLNASFGSSLVETKEEAKGSDNFQQLYLGLSVTAKEIVDKINEQLEISLPEGIQSLKPEEVTPEATAERIVSGVTAFFDVFAKQNNSLAGEALVDAFMGEIRKGVDKGYGEAVSILESLGAFNYDGVKEGIEETKSLIEKKLQAYESKKKEELGVSKPEAAKAESSISTVA